MINGNEIPDFGSRLKFLIGKDKCNKRGISQILAKDMLSKGLIEPDEGQTEENCISYSAKSIRNHLKCQSCDSVSAKWISVYMRYFNCSADFLLGRITAPTHRTTDICNNTGLSIPAAELLQEWNQAGFSGLIGCLSNLITNADFRDCLNTMMKLEELYAAKNGDFNRYADIHLRNQISMDLQGIPYTTEAIARDINKDIKTEKYNLNLTLTNMIDSIAKSAAE